MGTAAIILRHLIPALQGIQRELADLESRAQPAKEPQAVSPVKNTNADGEEKPRRRRLLSLREAAEFLRVSRSALYRLTSTKRIPHYRIGSRILLDEGRLIEWISQSAYDGEPTSTRGASGRR